MKKLFLKLLFLSMVLSLGISSHCWAQSSEMEDLDGELITGDGGRLSYDFCVTEANNNLEFCLKNAENAKTASSYFDSSAETNERAKERARIQCKADYKQRISLTCNCFLLENQNTTLCSSDPEIKYYECEIKAGIEFEMCVKFAKSSERLGCKTIYNEFLKECLADSLNLNPPLPVDPVS